MKRYLFALPLLLIMVCAGLFAFKGIKNTVEGKYIFFEVVANQVNPAAPLNSTPMTKAEFLATGSLPCQLGEREDCVRGWEQGITPTPTATPQEVIKKI
jgi:hypothetical protein